MRKGFLTETLNERLIMRVKRLEFECQECDKVFSRSVEVIFPRCPKCKSEDLYHIGWVSPKSRPSRPAELRPQRYSDYF